LQIKVFENKREIIMSLILTDYHDMIGTITINNPEKRNAMSNALLGEFSEALKEFKEQKARAVIIRAVKGSKVWSAGLDINEIPEPGRDPLAYNDPLENLLRDIQFFPAPVIAMIDGGVWGGACDLAFTCDILNGSPRASFAITPAKIGVPYNTSGILHFLHVTNIHIVKEMFFTADSMSAEQAKSNGILNNLLPEEVLESFTYNQARKIAENSPLSIAVIKEQLRILAASSPVSPNTFERIQGLRRIVYDSKDYIEGKKAFLEKRKPVFKGE
jgi:methylmalonyl-CoA decarboxylase